MKKLNYFLVFVFLFVNLFFVLPKTAYALNRIGIRQATKGKEFFDTVTNAKFIPRGNNWYFDPRSYNATDTNNTLDKFVQDHYNAVRIFIGFDAVGNSSGSGLSSQFMDKVAEFLKEANNRNLYVFIVLDIIPDKGGYFPSGYTPWVWEPTGATDDANTNEYYMNQSFIDAKKRYLKDFINGLHQRNAPAEAILGYEIQNEIRFLLTQKPFNQSGSVVTAGGTFNMSDSTQRVTAMAANLVNYSNQVVAAVKEVEPSALTSLSVFPPTALSSSDKYAVNSYWVFVDPDKGGSSVDFVDIHPYPWIAPLQKQMDDYQIFNNLNKPLVMGEFGLDMGQNPDISKSLNVLRDWQVSSCNFNYQGWFNWTWDVGAHLTGFYSMIESDYALDKVLAPINRSDPCKAENIPYTPTPTQAATATPTPSPTSVNVSGDITGPSGVKDNKVDNYDYTLLVSNFNKSGSNILGDLDNNGKVDVYDYNQMITILNK